MEPKLPSVPAESLLASFAPDDFECPTASGKLPAIDYRPRTTPVPCPDYVSATDDSGLGNSLSRLLCFLVSVAPGYQQARVQAPSAPSRSRPMQLPIPISLTPFLALSHEALHSRNTPDEDSCSISPIAGSVRASTASPGARPSPELPGSSAPGHHLFPFLSLPSGSPASPLAAFSRPSPALFSPALCFPRPRMASSVARLSVLPGHLDFDFPDNEPNSTSSVLAKLLQALPDSSTRSPSLSCHLFSLPPSSISHPTQNAWREARIVRAWEQLTASSHLPHALSSTFSLSLPSELPGSAFGYSPGSSVIAGKLRLLSAAPSAQRSALSLQPRSASRSRTRSASASHSASASSLTRRRHSPARHRPLLP